MKLYGIVLAVVLVLPGCGEEPERVERFDSSKQILVDEIWFSQKKRTVELVAGQTCEEKMEEIGAWRRTIPIGSDGCMVGGPGIGVTAKTDMSQFCRSPFWAKGEVELVCVSGPAP